MVNFVGGIMERIRAARHRIRLRRAKSATRTGLVRAYRKGHMFLTVKIMADWEADERIEWDSADTLSVLRVVDRERFERLIHQIEQETTNVR